MRPPENAFRALSETALLDWTTLETYLASSGVVLDLSESPRQFAGGLANLNYFVTIDGSPAVLRRPPSGDLPPGAHDMAREHKILSRLYHHLPLAPRSIHFCADKDVIGAPFQLLEYRSGLIVRGDDPGPARSNPACAARLSAAIIDVMASVHAVDPHAAGLSELGKPIGFVARGVAGWRKRAAAVAAAGAEGAPIAAVTAIGDWLERHAPDDASPPALLHNDIKLDNIILDPETLAPRAVLDWDMGTLGHPLFDLGTTLSYWVEPGDPECMQALKQMPTASPGFWTRGEAAAYYAKLTDADLSDAPFFRILGLFKLGVVFQQLEMRKAARGDAASRDYAALGAGILEYAAQSLSDGGL